MKYFLQVFDVAHDPSNRESMLHTLRNYKATTPLTEYVPGLVSNFTASIIKEIATTDLSSLDIGDLRDKALYLGIRCTPKTPTATLIA